MVTDVQQGLLLSNVLDNRWLARVALLAYHSATEQSRLLLLLGVALCDLPRRAPCCTPSLQALEAAAKAQGKTVEQFLADAAKGTAAAK